MVRSQKYLLKYGQCFDQRSHEYDTSAPFLMIHISNDPEHRHWLFFASEFPSEVIYELTTFFGKARLHSLLCVPLSS